MNTNPQAEVPVQLFTPRNARGFEMSDTTPPRVTLIADAARVVCIPDDLIWISHELSDGEGAKINPCDARRIAGVLVDSIAKSELLDDPAKYYVVRVVP